jgi:hypothetical protein
MIVFDTFDELMLRHDVCSSSFSEIHTWIKKSIKHTWKAWRTKQVDWGTSPSIANVLHQAPTSLLVQEKKESKSNTFWMLDSYCRNVLTCDGRHDFIWTPFWTFKYLMETLSSLHSYGSGLMSISSTRWPQSLIYYRDLFCPQCCVT